MKTLKMIAGLALAASVAACGTTDIATRNAPLAPGVSQVKRSETSPALQSLRVSKINVSVPKTLKVSEANRYYPMGDIVWRGEPMGDRHEQVKRIFETALATGTKPIRGKTPVVLDVEVTRFHSLTEKTRYTIGGVHSISFILTLRDARTGEILAAPRKIKADLEGYGGDQAIAADAAGQTQKVRITDHLARVIHHELAPALVAG